ncbi:uncharacterized protein LOC127873320 isoform X1 [Dreissena polymorpha]|uniref:uncharacterized protein LOC127873320 isoform X1 n=1 Tax=Dreissena polymorpha TaxID=45954 RepID=UPI0022656BD3|nr:uncharacterized protein LOC127873320 isoform X1 [Dreissena polymorpha]
MKPQLVAIWILLITCPAKKMEAQQNFLGGALHYSLTDAPNGKILANIELITGWILGKGPCGTNCSRASIGKSTLATRALLESQNYWYFGEFSTDYTVSPSQNVDIFWTGIRNITQIVQANMTENVIAVSENAKWEQEMAKFSFELTPDTLNEDLNFDGNYWRNLSLQYTYMRDLTSDWFLRWHLQTQINHEIRNDTRKRNKCPITLLRPIYRVKLNEISTIQLPYIDTDEDFVKCSLSQFIEAGDLFFAFPGIKVSEKCSITVDASYSNGFIDSTWIAIPITMRDYPTSVIMFGNNTITPYQSMCTFSVQFVVQILEHLDIPMFVAPTKEDGHEFYLFSGATWSTSVYAQAAKNTTIEEFIITVRNMENITIRTLHDYEGGDPRVRYAEISWTPSSQEEAHHIVCITAVNNTGMESEIRCFTLYVKSQQFNKSTETANVKPYFIDVPGVDDFLSCPVDATCVIPIFVKSNRTVSHLNVIDNFIDEIAPGSISQTTHRNENVFKIDLSFHHSTSGKWNVCIQAVDDLSQMSEPLCINLMFQPEDPCFSTPCENYGLCIKQADLSGFYYCECFHGYTGMTCETAPNPCDPDPCIHGSCFANQNPFYCFCSDDPETGQENAYTGTICDRRKDFCTASSCNNRSMCVSGISNYTCDCFSRYSGSNCEIDKCNQSVSNTTCKEMCSPNCENSGVCQNNSCQCTLAFTGRSCNESVGVNFVGGKFIPPTPTTGSNIECNKVNQVVMNCSFSVYLTSSSGYAPDMSIQTTSALQDRSTVGTTTTWPIAIGAKNLYHCIVEINGKIKDRRGHFACIHATDRFDIKLKDQACFKLQFIPTNTTFNKQELVHFVPPTLLEDSTFVCHLSERCGLVLASNEKNGDCETVVSAADTLTIFDPVHDGKGTCFSQVVVSTATVDSYTSCIRAGPYDYEERCYKFIVKNLTTDPCGSSGNPVNGYCQNDGKCFTEGDQDYQCFCSGDEYSGKNCSKGPCLPENSNCSQNGFCLTDGKTNTCMCQTGFNGTLCSTDIASTYQNSATNGARFVTFGKPNQVNCNKNRECGTYTYVFGTFQNNESPIVELGFVSEQLQDIKLETRKHTSTNNQFLTSVTFIPKDIGQYYLCLQTKNILSVNKDEVCFVVNVTAGVGLLYGKLDLPHFINPSLQPDSIFECSTDDECHVLYTVTLGEGNDQECIEYNVARAEDIKMHVFSTCQSCISPSNTNCTIDLAFRIPVFVNLNERKVCVSLLLKSSGERGEMRCFHISTNNTRQAYGCQVLECLNGGFCDGHVQDSPVCYCQIGFTGKTCETNVTNDENGSCLNTFNKMSGSISTEFRCPESNCSYPFTVCQANNTTLETGYVASQLDINISPSRNYKQNQCGCTTWVADLSSVFNGSFAFCLQIKDNATGIVLDEICPRASFTGSEASTPITYRDKPYFLVPTLPADSVVLCVQNETCNLNVYYTDGSTLGVPQQCPTLKDTSITKLVGLYVFPSQHMSTQCSSYLSYKPASTIFPGEVRTLCLKVSIQGKQGEERCFRLKIVANVPSELVRPCRGVTCFGDAVCTTGTEMQSGTCVCPPGFVGVNCFEKVNTTKDLPGVTGVNLTFSGPETPHFDLTHGITKTLSCFEGRECVTSISYNGQQSRPPIKGFCNSTLWVTESVQSSGISNSNSHELLVNVSGTAGIYKCCYQTTINGLKESPNIDEICIEVNILHQYNGVSGFMKEVQLTRPPANSTFICQANSTCHLSISTAQKNGKCDPIKECKNGLAGTHIFDPEIGPDGMCLTDIGYTTEGQQSVKDLCIKSGHNGEEQHFVLEINNSQGFGPCQKKHCLNGGRCSSESSTPVCICKAGFTDYNCGTEEECKIGSIPSSITCGSSSCFLDFLVTGSTRMPSIVERSSGHLSHTVKQDGAAYTFAIDINAHNTTEVCLNISTGGHTSECNMSTCIAVKYTDTSSIGTPVLNCTTKDGKPGECDIVLITTKPLSNGECPQLFVHPDTTLERVHIFENMLINSTNIMPHCVSQVSAHTPNESTQKLCIMDSAQILMCLNTTVTQPACKASTEATTQAKQLVMTGMVSCVCKLESSEPINVIKRNPRPSTKALTKVAGFGASGMAGAMAVGVLIYLVIKKIKAKPSTVKCMNAKPQPAMKPKAEVAPASPEVPSFLKRRQVRPEMAWEQGF